MARIRSIKPGFWQDSRLSRFPALTRLVYICLWSMSDDYGRIEGDAETVWHFGFPREKPEDISRALANLREASRVVPYRGQDGIDCLFLPYFNKHQKIDHPTESKIPAPPTVTSDSRTVREDSRALAKTRAGLDGMGLEGIGEDPKQVPGQAGDRQGLVALRAEAEPKPKAPKPLPPLVALWNRVAGEAGLPKVALFTSARERTAKAALVEEPDLGVWERAFQAIAADKFNRGGNDRHWRADFDYAVRPSKRGKWLDEARNANATENHAPVLTPAEVEADMARRRELTNRVRNGVA
jgi:hypothetical protein